jgi:hypothetical protein
VQVPIALKPPAGAGVDNAVVEFGYNPSFYCVGRLADTVWDGISEACAKGAQPGNDYGFVNDPMAGVPCSSGCTINIPAIPQRVLYYRWKYRNASNQVISISRTHIRAIP